MIHFPRKTGGLFNNSNIEDMPADVFDDADVIMDVDLMNELIPNDAALAPFDFDSLADCCADNELSLETADGALLDLDSLEEFLDLTEFFDFGQLSSSDDNPSQVASDVDDAASLCVQPLQPAASTIDAASLPAVLVSATTSADDASVTADHTYHHPTKRKALDAAESSSAAARHTQYIERRRKNNLACKRSRQTHKRRMIDMEEELVQLEWVNAGLRQRVVELEGDKQRMKSSLVDALRQAPR